MVEVFKNFNKTIQDYMVCNNNNDDKLKFIYQFKKTDLDTRKKKAIEILAKYPGRVPVIVDVNDSNTLAINKNKYIVPANLGLAHFIVELRKKINIDSSKSIFILINNKLMSSNDILSDIYDKNKELDGFLYMIVTVENVFG
jgi:GABA(A) receptor-associated protein